MDIYSRKFAVIIIIALVAILALQATSNSNVAQRIDSDTCEIYVMDPRINARQYLDEFDSKCVELKNMNP